MSTPNWYATRLAAGRLQRCYAIAPPRVQRYLEAEIQFVLDRLRPSDAVLELGCGYGRVALRLAAVAARVVGIDSAADSVALARALAGPRCELAVMDAITLGFRPATFDRVVCVQNGIGAFGVDPARLVREALRVTRPGGCLLLSSYAEAFWPERLRWFEAQAAEGLVGAIDRERTGHGVIACVDGFRSGTFTPDDFRDLAARLGLGARTTTVDESSVFCEIERPPIPSGATPAAR